MLASATAVVVLVGAVVTLVGVRRHEGAPPTAGVGAIDAGRASFTWPGSVWDVRVADAPVEGDSTHLAGELAAQVGGKYGPAAFNVWRYDTSIVTAGPDQRLVDVGFDNCQDKPSVPAGLLGPGGQFTDVPLPPDAAPAAGTDGELTVYSPSADALWEFWKLHRTTPSSSGATASTPGSGWTACWGGRLDHVSTSAGYFTNGFGASASGLAIIGGAVNIAEARSGHIDHALALAIPDPAPWKEVTWPAQRSDGSSGSRSSIAEGTRFRLDPSIDVDTLDLTPLAKMIALAAQQYGFIVSDKSGAVSVIAQDGAAAVTRSGGNPWSKLLGGTPSYKILDGFPWSSLQVVRPEFVRAAVGH